VRRSAADNQSFEAYSKSFHDDCVMALAIAVYAAESIHEPLQFRRVNLLAGTGDWISALGGQL
jgi:hypothetical protein